MSYPIQVDDGVIFDLRYVATIIGGFYGGIPVSIVLWIINIIYRIFLGGVGIYYTFIFATLHLSVIFLFYSAFRRWRKKKRIFNIGIISFCSALLLMISLQLNSSVDVPLSFELIFITIQTLSAVMICYCLELMREAKLIAQRVNKAEKLDIVNHLASSIAHELRNPLTVIQGFLKILLEKNVGEDNKQIIKLSYEETKRANDIIKNYLTFSKNAPEKRELLDTRQEVLKCTEIVSPLANMNSVMIQTQLQTDKDLWIIGEKQLFHQCLVNIMKNCIEAMPFGGVLQITMSQKGKKVTIEINDTGEGMTDEQLARIGEPFFTTKGREGTGLGLLSAIQIIESLGGSFKAKSTLSKGTCFYLVFPLHNEKHMSDKAIG